MTKATFCLYGSIPSFVTTHYGWGWFGFDRTVVKCLAYPLMFMVGGWV